MFAKFKNPTLKNNHEIIESFGLDETFKIVRFNHKPNTGAVYVS